MWAKERRKVDETEVTTTKRRWDTRYIEKIYNFFDLVVRITFVRKILFFLFVCFSFFPYYFLLVPVSVYFKYLDVALLKIFSRLVIVFHLIFLSGSCVFCMFSLIICVLFYWIWVFVLHRQNLLSFSSNACWNLAWNQHKLVCYDSVSLKYVFLELMAYYVIYYKYLRYLLQIDIRLFPYSSHNHLDLW